MAERVYMPPDHRCVVAAQIDRVRALERELGADHPVSFSSSQGAAEGAPAARLQEGVGQRVQEDRGKWAVAA